MTIKELEALVDLGLSLQKPFADRVTMRTADLSKFIDAVQQAIDHKSRIDNVLALAHARVTAPQVVSQAYGTGYNVALGRVEDVLKTPTD